MNIIETTLTFPRLIIRAHTTHIIIHHTASSDRPALTFHREHIKRGWGGIGYHYIIRRNGVIEQGRPENAIGAHTRGKNNVSIGIALTGNFQIIHPSVEQILSLRNLVILLREKYNMYWLSLYHSQEWSDRAG